MVRWSKRLDALALWVLVFPTFIILQILVGWPLGLPTGLASAVFLWVLYRTAKFVAMIIALKVHPRFRAERQASSIFNDGQLTGDYQRAVARLEDLMAREGETQARLLALSGQYIEMRDYSRALTIIHKIKLLAPKDELFLIEISEAHCLRELGLVDEGYAIIQRVVGEAPFVHQAHTEHAKFLSELGRCEEAWEAFALAKRRFRPLLTLLIGGRSLWKLTRKELGEAEQLLLSRCPRPKRRD